MVRYTNWTARLGYSLLLSVLLMFPFNPARSEVRSFYPTRINQSFQNQIVYASNRHGNYEIYSMDPDGKNISRLTNNKDIDFYPSVSSDGKVAFLRIKPDDSRYIIVHDGYGERPPIETSGTSLSAQAWSPDGKTIAFGSDTGVYTINPNGRNQRQLTEGYDVSPAWSPDGTTVAFIRINDGSGNMGTLYVKNLKTGNEIQITSTGRYRTPVWMGNNKVVLTEAQPFTAGCISIIDVETGDKRSITFPDDPYGTPQKPHGCFADWDPVPESKNRILFTGWEAEKTGGTFQLTRVTSVSNNINWDRVLFETLTKEGDNRTPTISSR